MASATSASTFVVMVATTASAVVTSTTASTSGSCEGCDFFSCRFVYINNFTIEMQCFASQRMVEVHNDNIFFYFQDRTVHAVAVRIAIRN